MVESLRSFAPEGRRHVAWGVSPRKADDINQKSPAGATAALNCRRPFGALESSVDLLPGAHAPGYMPGAPSGRSYPNSPFIRSMTPFSSLTGWPPISAMRRRICSSSGERSRGLGTATSTVTT